MAINLYKVKKWGAGFLMAFVPAISLITMILVGDFIQGLIAFMLVAPVSILIGHKIESHPILQYLEGKGLLVLTFDSTGTIDAFMVSVKNPYISGIYQGEKAETIFNRQSVFYMSLPKKAIGEVTEDENFEIMELKIPKNKKNEHLFGFEHFPVLIYNKNMKTFVTKDTLAETEKDAFVKHLVLYLNRKVEDLTSVLRDFARHVVEETRPRKSFFQGGWFKWVLIFAIIFLVVMFTLPYIMNTFEGVAAPAAKGIPNLITPN